MTFSNQDKVQKFGRQALRELQKRIVNRQRRRGDWLFFFSAFLIVFGIDYIARAVHNEGPDFFLYVLGVACIFSGLALYKRC